MISYNHLSPYYFLYILKFVESVRTAIGNYIDVWFLTYHTIAELTN